MKSKKILLLANMDITLLYFRQELIDKLLEEKYDVYVSFPKSENVEIFENKGCKFIDVQMERHGLNPFKDIKVIIKYLKIMKKIKPDFVLTYTIKPNIYGGIASRILKVSQIANITGLGTALENKGLLQKIAILLHRVALKKVHCCFAQNEENLEFLQKHKIAKNKLKLIPGSGVNLEKFKLLEYPNNETIEFLFISRIMKEKGIDQYLAMAQYIKSKYKNTKFHILGFCEQAYEEQIRNLEKEGIIEYHGRQDNIIPFMQRASCTIHPTFYPEGMSNVLLESCACGRPIITTNRSGCREIVDENKNGYIVREKDTKDLIEKVEKFINMSNEEKKIMGLAGRKKVEKEFDRNIVVNAYMKEIVSNQMKPIRVLQVVGKLNRGGTGTLIMNLYRNIDREKIQFDFIKHTTEECAYDEEINMLGGKIYSLPQYKVYNHFKYKKEWKKFFKENPEYKIIHGHVRSTAAIYLRIAKKYGLYTIAHSHSISSGKGIKAIIKNMLQYNIKYIADYFFGCSKEANIWLFGKKVANSERCEVLNNGIDVEKFKFNNQSRKNIRQLLDVKDDEILIGHVGRFCTAKNHEFLIEVFEEYLKKDPKAKLILIGNGELKEEIKKKVGLLNIEKKVIFQEEIENVQDYYSAMDLFLFPSIYEGLGIALIEAQTSGLECYASNTIPKEVDINKKIKFISLTKGAKYWSENILYNKTNRELLYESIINTEYNIKESAQRIEKIYIERGEEI